MHTGAINAENAADESIKTNGTSKIFTFLRKIKNEQKLLLGSS